MIDPDAAAVALAGVRELVAADGGDIVIASVDDDVLHLSLVLETAECAECVMPRAFLETVALDMLGAQIPGLSRVIIDDPRE